MRKALRLCALLAVVAMLAVAGAGGGVVTASAVPNRPSRVLIIVLDQMRPDYVDLFDMDNVRALRDGGVNFKNAIVGHMAAETVISHGVITSGKLPKNMGWVDEVYRDTADAVAPSGTGDYHVTSSLGCGDFASLIRAGGYPKLEDYLGQLENDGAGGDARFFAVGQKTTAACNAGHPVVAGADNDIIVRMGSAASRDCDGNTENGAETRFRPPAGVNVPSYIGTAVASACEQPRFNVNTTDAYGTATTSPAWMYPLDGDRYAFNPANSPTEAEEPGDERTLTEGNAGGDVWTADVAISLMQNEPDWRGMLVSFPDIDKMGHMWGTGTDDEGPSGQTGDVHEFAHMPYVAKKADQQVGRVLFQLDELGILDETLVILTADHAGQTARTHHGVDAAGRGDFNWYYGQDSDEDYRKPSPAIEQLLLATGGAKTQDPSKPGFYSYPGSTIDFVYGDSHLAAWMNTDTKAAKIQAAQAMRQLPDVIATYYRDGSRFVRVGGIGPMSKAESKWFTKIKADSLVNTMAAPNGPEVVGLLRDDVSYGVEGDHGGHQKLVQEIQIIFSWPGLPAKVRGEQVRLVDILPTTMRLMGMRATAPLDGKAYALP